MITICCTCGATRNTIIVCVRCRENLLLEIISLHDELARLKRGDFTDEELQNLCHNLDESDYEKFCAGCTEYQRKLFGKSPSDADAAIDRRNEAKGALRDGR